MRLASPCFIASGRRDSRQRPRSRGCATSSDGDSRIRHEEHADAAAVDDLGIVAPLRRLAPGRRGGGEMPAVGDQAAVLFRSGVATRTPKPISSWSPKANPSTLRREAHLPNRAASLPARAKGGRRRGPSPASLHPDPASSRWSSPRRFRPSRRARGRTARDDAALVPPEVVS